MLVALRRGRETYETAALPLSYVGASASIGDALKQQLSPSSRLNGVSTRLDEHTAPIADSCACFGARVGTLDHPFESAVETRPRAYGAGRPHSPNSSSCPGVWVI
jgi:hypothetical protein